MTDPSSSPADAITGKRVYECAKNDSNATLDVPRTAKRAKHERVDTAYVVVAPETATNEEENTNVTTPTSSTASSTLEEVRAWTTRRVVADTAAITVDLNAIVSAQKAWDHHDDNSAYQWPFWKLQSALKPYESEPMWNFLQDDQKDTIISIESRHWQTRPGNASRDERSFFQWLLLARHATQSRSKFPSTAKQTAQFALDQVADVVKEQWLSTSARHCLDFVKAKMAVAWTK